MRTAVMVAYHAIDSLAGLGKHQFLYPPRTLPTGETVGMIALVSGHDSLLGDWQFAHVALIRAGRADRVPVGQEQ